jgi:CheY-like chemotaxis protein
MLLRGLGVGTLGEAADGIAALDLLERSAAPDVILCDIDMPGMDGVEFIRHVAQRRLASAVAIASALDPRLLETIRAAVRATACRCWAPSASR